MKFFPDMTEQHAKFLQPLSLAFIGDAVFTLYARESVAVKTDAPSGALHLAATKKVKAAGQAALADALMPFFTEEEAGVFRRAKNCKHKTVAKNADSEDYGKATGLEAVLGYLYLIGREQRILELLQKEEGLCRK